MPVKDVTIVTGASSGIGRAVALRLAGAGRTVVAAARRAAELDTLVAEIAAAGGSAVAVPTDVTELGDLENLVAKADAVGPVEALVNVAGLGRVHSVLADDADVQRLLTVNLLAPIRLMRLVVPGMRERGRGSIVNIGSIAGEIGVDGPYSASKFGLRGMTDSVRRELAGSGIGVTLIEPGYIATAMTAERTGRMPGPEVIADTVAAAPVRPRRRVIVPGRYRAVAVLATVLPAAIDRQFAGTAGGAPPPPTRIAKVAALVRRARHRSTP
jgi:NAD(P)-dependent dehydrogenase (short-subunit alcohol dehydrogenase family)